MYNLTRFAREKYDHFALRAHLKSLGISLRSATEPIDDTSTGKLMEGVLASFAQFDNDVRSDRTRAGMRAALELGRWTFPAPHRISERAEMVWQEPGAGPGTRAAHRACVRGTRNGTIHEARSHCPNDRGRLAHAAWIGALAAKLRPDGAELDLRRQGREPGLWRVNPRRFRAARSTRPRSIACRLFSMAASSWPVHDSGNHPDFPLRGFVRCETCGRPLTGSWSKGRNGHYAYYHCQRQCRAVNISKATLEGAFVDELALLQPTPGYMRLVKDRILCVWEQRRAEAKDRTTEQQRRVSAIQQKLDKLDEAFLYSEAIDVTTYGRQRDKLREELTLAKIDHHAEAVDELDVEGILAFAERILPRASDLWVQASLDYKQRLQQLFFPEGIAFDGNRFNRTAATAPLFNYLAPSESADERVVSRTGIELLPPEYAHARCRRRISLE